jgi:hypothetical protein
MSSRHDIPKRWQFRLQELLIYMTVVAVGLGSFGYAARNSVSTFPQFMMLLGGWFTLVGCVGGLLGWLRGGTATAAMDGFLLALILAGPGTMLFIHMNGVNR